MRVRIIDDDLAFTLFLTTALEEAGIDHVSAGKPEEGLRLLADKG